MLKYFICPDNNKVEIKECLLKCRMKKRCAPIPFLQMAANDRDFKGKPSVTQCLNGTREEFLKITQDYAIKPTDRAFMILGSKAHAKLEKHEHAKTTIEEELELENIYGTYDILQEENGEFTLIDTKTTGSYKLKKILFHEVDSKTEVYKSGPRKGEPKKELVKNITPNPEEMYEWVMQINRYRQMIEKAKGISIKNMYIFAVVRDGNTKNSSMNGLDSCTYMLDVPRRNDEIINRYFNKKRDELIYYVKNNYLPPMCSDIECWKGNKCKNYCSVSRFCVGNPYLGEKE